MPNGVTVSADVSPEFNERIEDMVDRRDDLRNKSDGVRHLLREGAASVDGGLTLAQRFFKTAAIAFAMLALLIFAWASMGNYPRPAVLGAWIMVPALLSLLLYDLWPSIRARWAAEETVNPSEA